MIRPIWLLWVFTAGFVAGALAMRSMHTPPAAAEAFAVAAPTTSAAPALPIVAPDVEARETSGATLLSAVASPAPADTAAAVAVAGPDATQPVAATGFVQPIDASEVFNKMLARPSQPGFENQIGDAHRALEREMRDEGWANTMEAELQNAMLNEISMGAFKAEHIECRATMCEVRLSGTGPQAAAMKTWHDGLMGQPFGQRLFLNYGSSISNNDRTDMLMIFRKPPPPESVPPGPQQKSVQKRLTAG